MRYAIFKIPPQRFATRGGWDDFWHGSDDLDDAKLLVARDPHTIWQNLFLNVVQPPVYQIVDLTTGEVIDEM